MDDIGSLALMRTIVTIVSMLTFLGIVYWVFFKHARQDFDAQAKSILNENDLP